MNFLSHRTALKKWGPGRLRVPLGRQGDGTSQQEKQEVWARSDCDWTPPCLPAAPFMSLVLMVPCHLK